METRTKILRYALADDECFFHAIRFIRKSMEMLDIDMELHELIRSNFEILRRGEGAEREFIQNTNEIRLEWKMHIRDRYGQYINGKRGDLLKHEYWDKSGLGRGRSVLDFGCGQGFLVPYMLENDLAKSILGLDETDFAAAWRNITSDFKSRVSFEQVNLERVESFLSKKASTDLVLISYVLHHMQSYESDYFLSMLNRVVGRDSTVVFLEDAPSREQCPEHPGTDEQGGPSIQEIWEKLGAKHDLYPASGAFRLQVVLDWYANNFLASQEEVQITGNYRTLEEWKERIEQSGFEILQARFVGWPYHRDIDVPQSIIVAKAKT